MADDPRENQDIKDRDDVLLAFVAIRDRFSEMDDDTFQREILMPMTRWLWPIVMRNITDALPSDLRRQIDAHFMQPPNSDLTG